MNTLRVLSLVLASYVFHAAWAGDTDIHVVDDDCMQCMCQIESRCTDHKCIKDGTKKLEDGTVIDRMSCGWFQMQEDYYIDCYKPSVNSVAGMPDWEACAHDKECAELCVQKYMRRYGHGCQRVPKGSPITCETIARVHNGGPRGCRNKSTQHHWNKVKKCLDALKKK